MQAYFHTVQKFVACQSTSVQTCVNMSLSLRFSSDFLVSIKCKAIFAVTSFRNSSAQFFKPAWCVTLVSCVAVLPTYVIA